eukprot:215769-Prymnesium_polylepis.1
MAIARRRPRRVAHRARMRCPAAARRRRDAGEPARLSRQRERTREGLPVRQWLHAPGATDAAAAVADARNTAGSRRDRDGTCDAARRRSTGRRACGACRAR